MVRCEDCNQQIFRTKGELFNDEDYQVKHECSEYHAKSTFSTFNPDWKLETIYALLTKICAKLQDLERHNDCTRT